MELQKLATETVLEQARLTADELTRKDSIGISVILLTLYSGG